RLRHGVGDRLLGLGGDRHRLGHRLRHRPHLAAHRRALHRVDVVGDHRRRVDHVDRAHRARAAGGHRPGGATVMVGLGSAVVAAALAAGCASQAVGPRAREWLELRSGHFILATDLDRHRAEAVASGLEESWSALAHVYQVIVPGRPPPDHELRIVHLNDCADVHALRPGTGGFVELSADFLSDPTAVTCGAFVGRSRTSVLHEVAHVFNLHYLHAHPSWLNEGLATYFQSVAVEGGRILLGRVADSAADLWRMAVPVPALGVLWQGMPGPGAPPAFLRFLA